MYKEIDLVHQDDFENGKRYSIEEYEVRDNKWKNKLIKSALNVTQKIAGKCVKGLIKLFSKNDEGSEEDEEDDDDEEEDDNCDDDKPIIFKRIVSFDYDHKGVLEPNKEFSGFVQQFIAIKESEENKVENMVIKNMPMSYLHISHPIFVKLYGQAIGSTGTIENLIQLFSSCSSQKAIHFLVYQIKKYYLIQ